MKINTLITAALLAIAPLHSALAGSDQDCASTTANEYQPCWYIGAGLGLSHVDPEGKVNGWSTDDDSSDGFAIQIGQHFKPHWFWELKYVDAGEAGLGNDNPLLDQALSDAAIEYKIPSLMAGYFLRDPQHRLNFYGKAGAANIATRANDRRIGEDKKSSIQFALGVGAQYRFKQSPWILRAEFDSYDRDVNWWSISVSRYFDWSKS